MKVHKPDLQAFLPHQVDQEGQEDPVCRREEALKLKIQVCTPLRFVRHSEGVIVACTCLQACSADRSYISLPVD